MFLILLTLRLFGKTGFVQCIINKFLQDRCNDPGYDNNDCRFPQSDHHRNTVDFDQTHKNAAIAKERYKELRNNMVPPFFHG